MLVYVHPEDRADFAADIFVKANTISTVRKIK